MFFFSTIFVSAATLNTNSVKSWCFYEDAIKKVTLCRVYVCSLSLFLTQSLQMCVSVCVSVW